MNKLTGGQIIVQWMEDAKILHFFNVPGESFLPVFDALYDNNKIQVTSFRQESGASFAAEAYSKITKKPIVCMVTRGPGASNLSIGVQTAFYDGTPMIVLVGQVPTNKYRTNSFQEIDHTDFFRTISKETFYVSSPDQLPHILRQAQWLSVEGKPGPVVISLPADILAKKTAINIFPALPKKSELIDYGEIASSLIEKIIKSKNPLIISSMEAVRTEKSFLLELVAEKLGVPVCTGWRKFSSFPNDHSNYIGSLGLGGPKTPIEVMKKSDLIIGFGNIMEDINISGGERFPDHAEVYQFCSYIDKGTPRFLNNNDFHYMNHDELRLLRSFKNQIEHNYKDYQNKNRIEETKTLHNEYLSSMEIQSMDKSTKKRSRKNIHFKEINKWIPDNAIVVSDAGNFAHWLLRYIPFNKDRIYLGPINGAMGYAIPAGLGAKYALPNRPVWSIAGDGGALMTIGELETISRFNLDITIIVINNNNYGTINAHQEQEYPGRRIGTKLGSVSFQGIAKAMNWNSWEVKNEFEIKKTLEDASNIFGPKLIEIQVENEPLSLED